MREQGDMCIYYLYISKRNETRFNRREPTGVSNPYLNTATRTETAAP
jgi:hypothetical protein